MDQIRLSIAMCTYNGGRYLQEQLDSIASQTRQPDELVGCDDESSDDTIEIIKAFSSKVLFPVRLFNNKGNLGISKNFEKAIKLCQGDITLLSNQDDVWYTEKLMNSETIFSQEQGVGAVLTMLRRWVRN